MKFKKLTLHTHVLEKELKFYTETLGFPLLKNSRDKFSVQVGWTEMVFEKSETQHLYHYCFLIPSNHLHQALDWMEERLEVLNIEDGRKIQHFLSWNADSFYFMDASRNLAECIVRYDLENSETASFDLSKILGVNEIGMPTNNINLLNTKLESNLGTHFWKGDHQRFGTNGTQEGLWLLPNYLQKEHWFPTRIQIRPEPFQARVLVDGLEYEVEYKKERVKITVSNT